MGTLHEACCQPSPPSPAHAPPPAKMGLRGQCLSLAMAALRSAIPVRVTSGAWDMSVCRGKAGAFHRGILRSPDHRKRERSETSGLEAASEIGNIHCPRRPGRWCPLNSDTPSRTHQVILCHSHLRQAASWARTVFSNCRSQPASGL